MSTGPVWPLDGGAPGDLRAELRLGVDRGDGGEAGHGVVHLYKRTRVRWGVTRKFDVTIIVKSLKHEVDKL